MEANIRAAAMLPVRMRAAVLGGFEFFIVLKFVAFRSGNLQRRGRREGCIEGSVFRGPAASLRFQGGKWCSIDADTFLTAPSQIAIACPSAPIWG